MQYKGKEPERGFRYAALEFQNVGRARVMKSATNRYFPEELSSLITVGFLGICGWMIYDHSAIDNHPLLIMLGPRGAAFGAVVNSWLGSNKGPDRTKDLLAQTAPIGL